MTASATSTPPRRNAVWWLHWLLVMLLVFDQLSSPLHRHHHDNGVDAAGMSQGMVHSVHVGGMHLDDESAEPDGYHVAGAPRSDSNGSFLAADISPDGAAIAATWFADTWIASQGAATEIHWPNALALDRPARPVPLSRPPDGRAPPARA